MGTRVKPAYDSLLVAAPPSNRQISAIRHHNRSRDKGGKIGREKNRRSDDVLRFSGPPQRGVIDENLHQLRIAGARLLVQRGFDKTWPDRVDAHAVLPDLAASRLVKTSHPSFEAVEDGGGRGARC